LIPKNFGGESKNFGLHKSMELSSFLSQISTTSNTSLKSFRLNESEKIKNMQENKTKIKEIEYELPKMENEIRKAKIIVKNLENQIKILNSIDYKKMNGIDIDLEIVENSKVLQSLKEYEKVIKEHEKILMNK
jgi:hypothetical protein